MALGKLIPDKRVDDLKGEDLTVRICYSCGAVLGKDYVTEKTCGVKRFRHPDCQINPKGIAERIVYMENILGMTPPVVPYNPEECHISDVTLGVENVGAPIS
jgi:hypothetical protein